MSLSNLFVVGRNKRDSDAVAGDARIAKLLSNGAWQEVLVGAGETFWRFREFIHPSGQTLQFVIDSEELGLSKGHGEILRARDDASTWTRLTTANIPAPYNTLVADIAISADGTLWLIAGEESVTQTVTPAKVFKSTDQGDTWTQSLELGADGGGVAFGRKPPAYNIATHPTNASIIVVQGAETVAGRVRIWRTTNGGSTWTFVVPTLDGGLMPVTSGGTTRCFGFASDGNRLCLGIFQSNTVKLTDSTDDGTTWITRFTSATTTSSFVNQFKSKCGFNWWVNPDFVFKSPLDNSSFVVVAQVGLNGLASGVDLTSIDCDSTQLILGVDCVTCLVGSPTTPPPSVFRRPFDLSTNWAQFGNTMTDTLGYTLRVNATGLLGITTLAEVNDQGPCSNRGNETKRECVSMIGWEILVDSRGGYYSRARAFGMGMNNPGGLFSAQIPDAEITWNPGNVEGCFGGENGPYKVRRELIVNDYGINETPELKRLANSYLPTEDKALGGFTIVKFQVGGIQRATGSAPVPNKPLEAGDRIHLSGTCEGPCRIAAGNWVVDEIAYEFPQGISTVTISRRPAAQVGSYPQSNVRSLGESIAGIGQVFETAWFHVLDSAFKAKTINQTEAGLYDLFTFEHFMGTQPSSIIMIAVKKKIFNWWDDAEVAAAQPLYVPPGSLFDHTQVQGVGYDVVRVDERQISFQFRRYLFYDEVEGRWVYPEERFIKVWMLP